MDPVRTTQFIDLAMAVIALAAIVGSWIRWVQPTLKKYGQGVQSLGTFAAVQADVAARLLSIEKELKPNGGGSMRDELRMIGRQSRITAATMRSYVEESDDGSFETDDKGLWIFSNRALLRWVQRSVEDVTGYGWFGFVSRSDRDRIRNEWDIAISQKREFASEFMVVVDASKPFLVSIVARPIRDPVANEITGWLGHQRREALAPAFTIIRPDGE